jgi:hypothetical protein
MQRQRIQITVVCWLSPIFRKLPSEIAEWAHAMLFEATETDNAGEFVLWIFGVFITIVRMLVTYALHIVGARPLAATCCAFYFGCLAIFVFFRLMVEILSARIPLLWDSLWLSAGRCAALTVVFLAVAIGIWCRRNFARYLAIGVASVQLLTTISALNPGEDASLNFVKLCIDVAIIVLMGQRNLRPVFRSGPPEFKQG